MGKLVSSTANSDYIGRSILTATARDILIPVPSVASRSKVLIEGVIRKPRRFSSGASDLARISREFELVAIAPSLG